MPTPVAAGQIVQVTPRFLIEGQQTENVMYFECVNADTDMLADLLLVIAQCIILHLLPGLTNKILLESVKGKVVGPVIGPEDEWTPGPDDMVQGAGAGDSEPSFVAAVVSLHTTRGGRTGRGRMYIAGIPEAGTFGSYLATENITWNSIIAFLECIAAAFPLNELGTAAKYQWSIYSRKVGGVTKPPYPTAGLAHVTRYKLNTLLGTMRSRMVGHGK